EASLREAQLPFHHVPDEAALLQRVAALLAEGKIIGWFHGRMEFGPRALGARSILGDARNTTMQATMNLKIKFRESFRPFAPIVLQERAADIFDLRPGEESPYMLIVAPVRDRYRRTLAPETRRPARAALAGHSRGSTSRHQGGGPSTWKSAWGPRAPPGGSPGGPDRNSGGSGGLAGPSRPSGGRCCRPESSRRKRSRLGRTSHNVRPSSSRVGMALRGRSPWLADSRRRKLSVVAMRRPSAASRASGTRRRCDHSASMAPWTVSGASASGNAFSISSAQLAMRSVMRRSNWARSCSR
ncbi:MAG: hypothetical protein J0M20_14415, partial [Burkholderiales bacterium]|nr:hypothetical protein [Burkholderiales bacterium]